MRNVQWLSDSVRSYLLICPFFLLLLFEDGFDCEDCVVLLVEDFDVDVFAGAFSSSAFSVDINVCRRIVLSSDSNASTLESSTARLPIEEFSIRKSSMRQFFIFKSEMVALVSVRNLHITFSINTLVITVCSIVISVAVTF